MRFGSLFTGIGGFDEGLERAGMGCAWQVEQDPWAQQVLRRHWPDVPLYDDVREVGDGLEAVDLICGGFPCQDVSVAGRRAGLAGERSGLFYEFMRIVGTLAPRWVLIENVPGLLSSNEGRDMGAVLGTLGQLGYWWTYRSLDTQYFGPPQRRERVFIVGHLGAPCPPEVLLEPESVSGDSPPSREAREGATPILEVGARTGSSTEDIRAGIGIGRAGDPMYTLQAGKNHGVAHTLRGEGHDASEDGTGRGTPLVATTLRARDQARGVDSDCSDTLVTGFAVNQRREGRLQDVAGTVHAPSGTQVDGVFQIELQHQGAGGNRGYANPGEPAPTIGTGGISGVFAIAPRRLTPTEASRLQGFPDGWNAWGLDEGGERVEISDSQRYKQLGNAVTVPVAEWIGRRIMAEDSQEATTPTT